MRPLLTLALSGATALPAATLAQEVPAADPPSAPAPLSAPPPVAAEPDQLTIPLQAEAAPARAEVKPSLDGTRPTTVAPVIVEGKDPPKDNNLGQKVGSVAGGVVGGFAGAAVAGPVGKVAGGLVGKRLAKALVGDGKDKKKNTPQIRAAQTAPSADQAAAETAALVATPPQLKPVADPEAPSP